MKTKNIKTHFHSLCAVKLLFANLTSLIKEVTIKRENIAPHSVKTNIRRIFFLFFLAIIKLIRFVIFFNLYKLFLCLKREVFFIFSIRLKNIRTFIVLFIILSLLFICLFISSNFLFLFVSSVFYLIRASLLKRTNKMRCNLMYSSSIILFLFIC